MGPEVAKRSAFLTGWRCQSLYNLIFISHEMSDSYSVVVRLAQLFGRHNGKAVYESATEGIRNVDPALRVAVRRRGLVNFHGTAQGYLIDSYLCHEESSGVSAWIRLGSELCREKTCFEDLSVVNDDG